MPGERVAFKRYGGLFTMPQKDLRCEGYRCHGGAFTLGPVEWKQCDKKAAVMIKFQQDKKTRELPACHTCWNEVMNSPKIKILSVRPLVDADAEEVQELGKTERRRGWS